jgi:hypothetical protein
MAITIATMGRFMKNFDMLGALRIDCHSVSDFGNSFRHNAVARAHAAFDDPHFARALANLHCADRDAVVRADNGYLIVTLQFVHRTLRDQERTLAESGHGAHTAKLAGPKKIAGICKQRGHANSTCLRVDLAVRECDFAGMRINVAVGQSELQRNSAGEVTGDTQVFLLADGKVDLDRIYIGNSGQQSGWTDEIPNLGGGDAGNAADQRTDFGKAEIQLGHFDSSFAGLYRGLTGCDEGFVLRLRLNVGIELALRDGVGFGKRGVALDVDL